MTRTFISFSETAGLLQTDDEGLRQKIAFSLFDCPAYVEVAPHYTIAYLQGHDLKREGDALLMRPAELVDGSQFPASNSCEFCDWDEQETTRGITGFGSVYELRGFFRIVGSVSGAARDGYLSGVAVAPDEWFKDPHADSSDLAPDLSFGLLSPSWGNYDKPPRELSKLMFKYEHVRRFIDSQSKQNVATDMNNFEEKSLGTRERNNLLRIIAALAKIASIDVAEGGKGAQQIERALQLADFDGPKEKAIRKVLADVRSVQ